MFNFFGSYGKYLWLKHQSVYLFVSAKNPGERFWKTALF